VVPAVCFEAAGVVGVIKPAGLPTQAPPGVGSLEQWLRAQLPQGSYLGVPHRLDRAVSGVILFAVTPRAARQLSRQFERRQVTKTYLAMTEVHSPTHHDGTGAAGSAAESEWIDWVAKVPDQPRARIAARGEANARQAETRVCQIGGLVGPDGFVIAMLQLQPRTGRMHQLRVQAAARGMPILGDTGYGGRYDLGADPTWAHWQSVGERQLDQIALHAWRIAFTNPDTKKPIEIEAPLPQSWPDACREMLRTMSGGVTRMDPNPSG
jgi:23S rRNA pseudouridine1911/1915/1917 synthase